MAITPSFRSCAVAFVLVGAGIAVGGFGAITAVRASRNPESWLHTVRYGSPPTAARPASDASDDNTEEAMLARRYGPIRQSQGYEEWIVRDFFQDKRNGVFVDVGSADYKVGSNTWFLETQLGWSGIAIDAQAGYQDGFRQFRRRTRFFSFFVSDHSNDKARLYLSGTLPFVASKEKDFTAQFGPVQGAAEVETITLNDLLDAQGVMSFDFLSMDIELSEPQGLAGFDIQRFKPRLAVVEAHSNVRQKILDYFNANGYIVVGKYLRVDPNNLWFMPVGASVTPFPTQALPH